MIPLIEFKIFYRVLNCFSLKLIDYGGSVIYKNKPITQTVMTTAYNANMKFKNLTFAESKYKDWFSFMRTFRNDEEYVVSPITYFKDAKLYKLFDTTNVTIKNYKMKLKEIILYINSI